MQQSELFMNNLLYIFIVVLVFRVVNWYNYIQCLDNILFYETGLLYEFVEYNQFPG